MQGANKGAIPALELMIHLELTSVTGRSAGMVSDAML